MSEKKVLKKLGISDFRHMTKEKVVKFASMLPNMDPEVAKKALEQFPTFKELASDIVTQYKEIIDKAIDENAVSSKTFYDVCNSIIQSLQKELEEDNITSEDRERIEDKMIQVAQMIGEKDSENKGFLLKCIGLGTFAITCICGAAAAILGSNTQISQNDDYDEDDDIV
jgi:hypothetical protein